MIFLPVWVDCAVVGLMAFLAGFAYWMLLAEVLAVLIKAIQEGDR